MGERRARAPAEKEGRRAELLAAAARLFDRSRYAALTMADVAAEAGVAKGTTYLYFRTKESLFLALLQDELEAWFGALASAFPAAAASRVTAPPAPAPPAPGPPEPAAALARRIAGSLAARPRLVRLLGLLHLTLEQNLDVHEVRAWKRWLAERLAAAAPLLGPPGAAPTPAAAVRTFLYVHALVVGVGQMAEPSPVLDEVLAEPELASLRVEFEPDLAEALTRLLRGAGG